MLKREKAGAEGQDNLSSEGKRGSQGIEGRKRPFSVDGPRKIHALSSAIKRTKRNGKSEA